MLKSLTKDFKIMFVLLAALVILFVVWEGFIVSDIFSGGDGDIFSAIPNSKNAFSSSYASLFNLEDNPFKVSEVFDELQDELVQKAIDEIKSPITEQSNISSQVSSDPNAIQTVNNIKTLTFPEEGEVVKSFYRDPGDYRPGIITGMDAFPLEMGTETAIESYMKGHVGQTIAKLNKLFPNNNCSPGKYRRGELALYHDDKSGMDYYAVAVSVDFAKPGDILKCYSNSKSKPVINAVVADLKSRSHKTTGPLKNRLGATQVQGPLGHAYLVGNGGIQMGGVEFFITDQKDIGKNSAKFFKYGEFMNEGKIKFTKLEIVGKLK